MRTRAELVATMRAFLSDRRRGIREEDFARLAGVNATYMRDVFIGRRYPLSATLAERIERAYQLWESGRVRVYSRSGGLKNSRVKIVNDAKPLVRRVLRVDISGKTPKMVVAIRRRADYGVF